MSGSGARFGRCGGVEATEYQRIRPVFGDAGLAGMAVLLDCCWIFGRIVLNHVWSFVMFLIIEYQQVGGVLLVGVLVCSDGQGFGEGHYRVHLTSSGRAWSPVFWGQGLHYASFVFMCVGVLFAVLQFRSSVAWLCCLGCRSRGVLFDRCRLFLVTCIVWFLASYD